MGWEGSWGGAERGLDLVEKSGGVGGGHCGLGGLGCFFSLYRC